MANEGSQKSKNFFQNAISKTGEASKKAFEAIKIKSHELADQGQAKSHELRMKKYNPLFPEEYMDPDFKLPTLIQIVDEDKRKGIDVCEGAMGWMSEEKDVKTMHIYDSAVKNSGIRFFPQPQCGAAYYIDPHQDDLYVNTDCYFSNMQEEKLAELQQIAYLLGAKQYWVEVVAGSNESSETQKSVTAKMPKFGSQKASLEYSTSKAFSSKGIANAAFSGTREPQKPPLCWYANDRNMQNLINIRCSEQGMAMTDYTIELSNSATMSVNTAAKIDAAVVKMGLSCNFNKKGQEEHNQKMFFKLEF